MGSIKVGTGRVKSKKKKRKKKKEKSLWVDLIYPTLLTMVHMVPVA
jgi:hypothetical protein